MPESISYTAARATLSATIDKVVQNREPIVIKKKNQAVVMISLADYESWAETVYLLRSPKNAQRLMDSIAELDKSDGIEKSFEELLNDKH